MTNPAERYCLPGLKQLYHEDNKGCFIGVKLQFGQLISTVAFCKINFNFVVASLEAGSF